MGRGTHGGGRSGGCCVLVATWIALALWGCTTVTPPWNEAIETETTYDAQTGTPIATTQTRSRSRGAGLQSTLRAPPETFTPGDAARTSIGRETTSAGDTERRASTGASGRKSGMKGGVLGISIFYWLGGIAIIAGALAAFWLGRRTLGYVLMGAGVGIAVLGYLIPAYGGWILIGIAVASVVAFLFFTKAGRDALATLKALVMGVDKTENTDAAAAEAVKENIAKEMDKSATSRHTMDRLVELTKNGG